MTDITWTNDTRKLSDLVPWEHNPKRMTRKQADGLRLSIERFGFAVPFLVSPDGDIYDGHQRQALMNAIKEYGPDAVVDVRVSSRPLTDDERRELVVRLKQNQASWDFEMLPNLYEREELLEWGFEPEELGMFPDEPTGDDPGAQVDKAAELQAKWGTATGQLWLLDSGNGNPHRLVCGDCTDREVVARVMGGERAGMVFADPPYNVNIKGKFTGTIEGDNLPDSEFLQLLIGAFDGIKFACSGSWYICFEILNIALFASALGESPDEIICWAKDSASFYSDDRYNRQYEMLFFFQNKGSLHVKGETNLWQFPKSSSFNHRDENERRFNEAGSWLTIHPTTKPIQLVERAIQNSSLVGGLVYDPFLGSGTTMVAAQRLGRRCRACEIEPGYVAVALERFYQMTGKTPVLLAHSSSGEAVDNAA